MNELKEKKERMNEEDLLFKNKTYQDEIILGIMIFSGKRYDLRDSLLNTIIHQEE